MNLRLRFAFSLLVAVGGCADANGQPRKSDLDRLQGTWEAKTGPEGEITALLKVEGKHAVAQLRKDGRELVTIRGEIKLDDSAAPKTFDMTEDGNAKPGYLAIYKLDEDTFTVCTGDAAFGRPTEFKEGERGMPALKVYKRAKPEAGAGLDTDHADGPG